jgi:hypothetical protein
VLRKRQDGGYDLKTGRAGRHGGELIARIVEQLPSTTRVTIHIEHQSQGSREAEIAATGQAALRVTQGSALMAPGQAWQHQRGQASPIGPQPHVAFPAPAQPTQPAALRMCSYCSQQIGHAPGACSECGTPHGASRAWQQALMAENDR